MRPYIYLMFFLILSQISYGQNTYKQDKSIVHGPFRNPIIENSNIYFSKSQETNYPLYLILENTGAHDNGLVIDKYETSGSDPHIESAFFFPIKKENNLLVIVSWEINSRGLGTYGILYQVYAYKKNNNSLVSNRIISSDSHMTGMEGYIEGVESTFKLKTASDVKAYIKKNL
ncbi:MULTISPECIES: hypothetical protein [Pseudomonas]|uniref:hypothetical protein n=1 Tax=Pseudomonas TaxID=286 RepID=UPI002499EBC2|nr:MULTISPECIES: hypothetical protein [Pseudomonas]